MPGNANSGRRPNPTALHVLRGNPSKKRLNDREPMPPRVNESFDTPPPDLDGDPVALAEWARVVPLLRVSGMISTAERLALIALCQQWSRYAEAHGKIRSLGMVVKGKGDQPIVNPYLKIADKALTQCGRLWVELGLTPSSRSRLSALPAVELATAPKTKWATLL